MKQTRFPHLFEISFLSVVGLAAGCYGAAPPRPLPIPLPEQTAGTTITVTTQEDVSMQANRT